MSDAALLTLEGFVRSSENELAVRAAAMVAEAPGALYNPLVLHGPAGVGKTHLLHSIASRAHARDSSLTILIEDGERLAERVTQAAAARRLDELREALGGADLLLVDDIERLFGMDLTREVMADVLRSLVDRGRQVVVTSRASVSPAAGDIDGLRRLLGSSIIVDVEPLGAAGREMLLRKLAAESSRNLSEDIVRLVVESPPGDARDLIKVVDGLSRIGNPTIGDVYRIMGNEAVAPAEDEFESFLADIAQTVSVVVETAPWRRRIVQAILRWEGEGIETNRLDQALRADTPPDVDVLIDSFARDAERLLQIRAALAGDPRADTLVDPDQLESAEALLATAQADGVRPTEGDEFLLDATGEPSPRYPWFLDPVRVDLAWTDVTGRMAEGPR